MSAIFILILILIILFGVAAGFIWLHSRQKTDQLRYEFITIITHKLRTPLTQIKWSAENLLSSETDPYRKQTITDIQASNEHLIKETGTLVELTDSANKAALTYNFEQLDLCAVARESAAETKNTFHEKNIFLSIQCDIPQVLVKGDHEHLKFVLGTILENACSYSPPGRNVEIHVGVDGNKAIAAITDHGIGIAPHDLSRVFSKFFRAKNAQTMDTEGFGVGLYLARSVMKRHKGDIRVFSEGTDRGSTFSIILPAV